MLRKSRSQVGKDRSPHQSPGFDSMDADALSDQIITWVGAQRPPLGEILMELGSIHPDDLLSALRAQRETEDSGSDAGSGPSRHVRLGEALLQAGVITEIELAAGLAAQFGVPLANLRTDRPTQEALDRIPEEQARRYGVIPMRVESDRVFVATSEPLDVEAIGDLTRHARRLGLMIGARDDIARLLDESYDALASAHVHIQAFELVEGGIADAGDGGTLEVDDNAPIVQVVNRLVWQGVRSRASDIHIEPMPDHVRVRYRVDGALSEAITVPAQMGAPIASRIKVMAELNIVERRRPQDGQFSVHVDGRPIDIRASIVGTIHGEKVVLRLLDTSRSLISLNNLGMAIDQVDSYLKVARAPLGMVLCTGPTGSGKTTTLYATLSEVNDPTRNVVTIEDPVEYHFTGVNQMQVSDAGISFAAGLRGILRQDPDIILVGEIRDEETARIAMQASLTGHLVLSSLHAVDAAAAVHRFTDMGIEPFLVASSINAVVGQRLLRRICSNCRETYVPSPADIAVMESALSAVPDEWTRGAGCNVCSGTGYRGRTGVYEFLYIDDAVRELIVAKATHADLHRTAVREGMVPMQQQALGLVLDGVTTVEDVLRNVYAPAMGGGSERTAFTGVAADTPERGPEDLVAPNAFQPTTRPGQGVW